MDVLQSEIDALETAMGEINAKKREMRDRKEALEQKRRLEQLEHLKPLAVRAHDLLCQWNHTDGCSWHYEIKDGEHNEWVGEYCAHARWLAAVEEWTQHQGCGERLTPEKLSAILDIVEQGKAQHRDFLHIIRNVIRP